MAPKKSVLAMVTLPSMLCAEQVRVRGVQPELEDPGHVRLLLHPPHPPLRVRGHHPPPRRAAGGPLCRASLITMGPFGVYISSLWAPWHSPLIAVGPFGAHKLHYGPHSFTPPIRLFESAAIILHLAEQQVGPFRVHPSSRWAPLTCIPHQHGPLWHVYLITQGITQGPFGVHP